MRKKIAILGSTGSIGKTLINIIKQDKKNFEIVLLSADGNYKEILKQAKIDNVNVFELLDTLKGLDGTQLSYIVTEVLNNNRVNTSSLGYKVESPSDLSEKRNIVV